MRSNLSRIISTIISLSIFLVSCGSSCPPESVTYLKPPYPPANTENPSQQAIIEIKRQEIHFDEIITGPVCNDTWSGQVYVTCDIQIPTWEGDPFFFQDCDLEIEEDTLVYVEAHNNKLYDEGCSCHE